MDANLITLMYFVLSLVSFFFICLGFLFYSYRQRKQKTLVLKKEIEKIIMDLGSSCGINPRIKQLIDIYNNQLKEANEARFKEILQLRNDLKREYEDLTQILSAY